MTSQEQYNRYNRKLLMLLAVAFGILLGLLPTFGLAVYTENLNHLPISLEASIAVTVSSIGLFSFLTLQEPKWLVITGILGLVLVKAILLYVLLFQLHIPLKNEPTNLHHLYGNANTLLGYFHGFAFLLAANLVLLYLIIEAIYPKFAALLEVIPFVGLVYNFMQVVSILLIGFLEGNKFLLDASGLSGLLSITLFVGSIFLFSENNSLTYFLPSRSESGFMFRFALVFTVCIPVLLINLFFKTYHGITNANQLMASQVLILVYVLIVVSGVFRFSNKVRNYQSKQLAHETELIEKNIEITKVNQELDSATKVLSFYNAEIQRNYTQLKASSEIQAQQQIHIEQLLASSLAESENKYKSIFDSHPLPVVLFGISDGVVLNANLAAQRLYGYHLEQFKQLSYNDLLADDVDYFSGPHSLFTNERATRAITLKHKDGKGKMLMVETLGYAIDYEGEQAYMAVFINVTEKYITDYRFKSLSDSLQVVFFEIDRDYNYMYMNKFCEQLVQRSAAELIGTNMLDFLPSYKGSEFLEKVNLTITSQEPQSMLLKVTDKMLNGTFFDVYFYPTPSGVAVLSREVTKEQQIRIAFQKQQELIKAIVTTIPSLVYIRDLQTEEFDFANGGLSNILGQENYPAPRRLNDIRNLVHPADLYLFEEVLAKPIEILKRQPTINVEYRIKGKDTGYVYVNHRLVPFETDASGNLIKVLSVLNSVQDYKQIQNELILAKSKAEDANIAKSNFLANMSHELRNPLHALSGITQILERDYSEEPRLALYVDLMKQSTTRLLDTIGDVLDLSKIEQNKISVQMSNFDLVSFIDKAVQVYSPMVQRKGLYLNFQHNFESLEVYLDPDLLDRILANLISNAVKFTFTGGITILLEQFLEPTVAKVIITISDTGIGMSSKFLENNIFQSFEQESGGFTKVYQGTGLGLHLVKKYIEQQNGAIWVESQKNIGSTFYLMFKQTIQETTTNNLNETENITYRR